MTAPPYFQRYDNLASERATYGDTPHPDFGITGGDGVHVVWEEIVGATAADLAYRATT
jgi:hypothetical protein